MILLIETSGFLAEVTESQVRLSGHRKDRDFWRMAADIPLSQWPEWRQKEIGEALNAVPGWIHTETLPEGRHPLRMGRIEAITVTQDRQIFLTLAPTADPLNPREVLWQSGEPCPVALTPTHLAAAWDARAHQARLERFDELLGAWNVRSWWSDRERAAAAAASASARMGNWDEAFTHINNACEDPERSGAGLVIACRYVRMLTADGAACEQLMEDWRATARAFDGRS